MLVFSPYLHTSSSFSVYQFELADYLLDSKDNGFVLYITRNWFLNL